MSSMKFVAAAALAAGASAQTLSSVGAEFQYMGDSASSESE